MLTKQCNGCGAIIPYGTVYCDGCQPVIDKQRDEAKAKRHRYYDRGQRDKRSAAFYNSKPWKMLSATRLQKDQYTCMKCGSIATEVHHIIAIKKDWSKRFEWDNLMSLCTACHNCIRD